MDILKWIRHPTNASWPMNESVYTNCSRMPLETHFIIQGRHNMQHMTISWGFPLTLKRSSGNVTRDCICYVHCDPFMLGDCMIFYHSFIKSILIFSFTRWFHSLNLQNRTSLNSITKICYKIICCRQHCPDCRIQGRTATIVPTAVWLLKSDPSLAHPNPS